MTNGSYNFSPYGRRAIAFVEVITVGSWRVKAYSITYRQSRADAALLLDGARVVKEHLADFRTRHEVYGIAFMSVHEGLSENQVILDLWANQNELIHFVFVSPSTAPYLFIPPDHDHNSVCIWELYLQSFERQAWIHCVLRRWQEPDFKAYLSARLNTYI